MYILIKVLKAKILALEDLYLIYKEDLKVKCDDIPKRLSALNKFNSCYQNNDCSLDTNEQIERLYHETDEYKDLETLNRLTTINQNILGSRIPGVILTFFLPR